MTKKFKVIMEFLEEMDDQKLFNQLVEAFPDLARLAVIDPGPGILPDGTVIESKSKD